MARLLSIGLTLVILAGYSAYALLRPLPLLTPTILPVSSYAAQSVGLTWPNYGSSAIGAVGYGMLETHGPDKPLPTASTIKVLTALLVLNQQPLQLGEAGPTITISQADIASYNKYVALDGSVVRVKLGEQLSEYQALQALLIPSANNIAETLARWTFGSTDTFNRYANEYAIKVGLNYTSVTDPSGFLSTTVSSPSDLVRLGMLALDNPVVAEIVGQSQTTLPVQGVVHNYNMLLGVDSIIGIKTGNNDQNRGCLLFATKQTVNGQHLTIVGVVANAPDLWQAQRDSLALMRSINKNFAALHAATATTKLVRYDVPWAGSIYGVPARASDLLVWRNSTTTLQTSAENQRTPSAPGTVVGTLVVRNDKIGTDTVVPIVLSGHLAEPGIWWRLTHPIQ